MMGNFLKLFVWIIHQLIHWLFAYKVVFHGVVFFISQGVYSAVMAERYLKIAIGITKDVIFLLKSSLFIA